MRKEKGFFFQLAQESDIVIEGFRPGVVDRLGVGYSEICKHNPAIIYCGISGYGQDGEANQTAGHDVNYLSRAGILNQIGEEGMPPAIPAIQIADIAGGGMNAVIGILLALHERNSSGLGQYIDISMTDGVLGLLTLSCILEKKTGRKQDRSTSMLSHRYGCYNTYETADGRYLAIGAVENRFWKELCSILGVAEFAALQYDETQRLAIIERLRAIFKEKPLKHWHTLLSAADVCYSKIQTVEEVFVDPLFIERNMVVDFEGAQGPEKTFGIPVKLTRTPGSIESSPQPFGSATRDVLAELGYSGESISQLFEKGIV